ncbi:TonB-dependent siderophore receptor [Pusillimonas sp. TS35]|nr:TonB-dependent siderophore receptor [Pusillimonas sp. TS35]
MNTHFPRAPMPASSPVFGGARFSVVCRLTPAASRPSPFHMPARASGGQHLSRLRAQAFLVALVLGFAQTPVLAQRGFAARLAPITVSGQRQSAAPTEGTGAYTAPAAETATPLGLAPRDTPQSVSTMTRQRMDDQGLNQLTDVIAQTPGLTYSSSANTATDQSVTYARGFRVENFQVDGVGLVYSSYSSIFQANDMAIYDRVEVVRGATGLMNGVGSPGATINQIRKRPTHGFHASLKAEAGAWDYYRGQADISTPLNESGSLRGRLVVARQKNQSYIDRLEERASVLYGILEADLGESTLATLGFAYQQHDATGHARSARPPFYSDGTRAHWGRSDSAAAVWAYGKRRTQDLFASLEHRLENGWRLKAIYSNAVNVYDEKLGYAMFGAPDKVTGAGLGLWAGRWRGKPTQHTLDLSAKGPFQLFGRRHDAAVGVTASRVTDRAPNYNLWYFSGWSNAIPNIYTWDGRTPAEPPNPSNGNRRERENVASAYATVRLRPTDQLAVIAGARVTNWRQSKATYPIGKPARFEHRAESGRITPYLGVVYDLNDQWSAYASYTNIFKPQNKKGLSGKTLDPLVGNSYEAGLKGEFMDGLLNVAGAVFLIQQDNFAVALPGQLAPDGSTAYEAVAGARTRGFELELAGQLARNWQASASYTRALSQDRNHTSLNTQIPQNTFKLFTTYRIPGIGGGLTVGGGLRWQNRIYSDNIGSRKARVTQGGYALVDLMARYDISRRVSVYANLYNVFDKVYYTTSGYSYYGAPRSIKAGLDIRY